METVLTLPVRVTILVSIAALVGTTCYRATEHLRSGSDDEILVAKPVVEAPEILDEHSDSPSIPLRIFVPVVVAGILLCFWQTADFSKFRKQPRQNNHLDCPVSRKYTNCRGVRR